MDDQIRDILERLDKLEKAVFSRSDGLSDKEATSSVMGDLDYTLNERAFLKRNGAGLNGQSCFVLICAYLSKGREAVPIGLKDIIGLWKSCSGVIGYPYQSIYSTRAKDHGWIDVPKDQRGAYMLREGWQRAIDRK